MPTIPQLLVPLLHSARISHQFIMFIEHLEVGTAQGDVGAVAGVKRCKVFCSHIQVRSQCWLLEQLDQLIGQFP